MAGQIVMQGFVRFHIPLWVRRLVTMVPPFIVVALGADTTQALVLSQVVLSLALPVPMVTLLILTRRKDIMGEYANKPVTQIFALLAAAVVLTLNLLLILQVAGVPML
jgi:manganese transport protein